MTASLITIGVPGAGKTTWLAKNANSYRHHSADNLRTINGVYTFDPAKEADIHQACLRMFARDLVNGLDVICDNTNTTLVQIAPYVALGMAFSDECRVVWVNGPSPSECARRNVHGVPEHVIFQKRREIIDMLGNWPTHWPKVEEV